MYKANEVVTNTMWGDH